MRLLIDAGNTRLKWRLEHDLTVISQGRGSMSSDHPLSDIDQYLGTVSRVAVSTVAREDLRLALHAYLQERVPGEVCFYWAEKERLGLRNSYSDVSAMGADRWHGMYGAWKKRGRGCAVIDAGSAITIDYVSDSGNHLGGYILPGLAMMFKSLKTDAARIAFEPNHAVALEPGQNTGECVNHGMSWVSLAIVQQLHRDVEQMGLSDILVTGGDASRLQAVGLNASEHPSLVLDGLGFIDHEVFSA